MTRAVANSRQRRVVVTALPLKQQARVRLAELLVDSDVVDIRDTVVEADLVLTPACSPQTVAALKHAFPTARLVVVEIEDWEFHIDLPGPVMRLLKAGADGYVTAESLDRLAEQLTTRSSADQPQVDVPGELPPSSVDDIIMSGLTDLTDRRSAVRRPGNDTSS